MLAEKYRQINNENMAMAISASLIMPWLAVWFVWGQQWDWIMRGCHSKQMRNEVSTTPDQQSNVVQINDFRHSKFSR